MAIRLRNGKQTKKNIYIYLNFVTELKHTAKPNLSLELKMTCG